MVRLEELFANKKLEDIEKEIEKLDVLLGELKGWIEDLKEKEELNERYAEIVRGLRGVTVEIRYVKDELFRILGKNVYLAKYGRENE